MLIQRDDYITVEMYRQMIGFSSKQSVKNAIKDGRLQAIDWYGTIMIPKNAILIDKRITHGRTIGQAAIKRRLREQAKEKGYTDERILGLEEE
jgi:hypothetical protein